jgi:outer membrane protein TolC
MAWQVRSRVRSGLVALYAAREGLTLSAQLAERGAENARILEKQFQLGAISAFERTQARIVAENAQLARQDAARLETEALVSLAEAIGVPVGAVEGVGLSFEGLAEAPAPPTLVSARTTALQGRADVLAALDEYAASQAALQLEIAKQYPDIRLGPGYEYDQGDNKWSVGLGFDLPVFNRNRGAIAEATAKREEAAARFVAVQARVMADVDGALAGYEAAVESRSTAEALVSSLEKQENRARSMLTLGEISRSELLGLQVEVSVQALARLDAVTKSLQAFGALETALQSTLGVPEATWQDSARARDPRVPKKEENGKHP